MKKLTILFDLDGTLIDATEAILEGFDVAYKKHGDKKPDDKKIIALIGLPLELMFKELGVDGNNLDSYVASYKEHYRKISIQKTKLLPKAIQAIKLAHNRVNLGIVTTKTARYSRELLEHLGLMDYFLVLVGREDVENPKPHSEPIIKAMHKIAALKEHTFMIGDTCLDMISAKDAGIRGIGVLSGYANKEQLSRCTNIIFDDVLEAVEYILSRE